jgi:hypothetical protein
MRLSEIASGSLANPNIPDFLNPVHVCDMDGYQIMHDTWKGYQVFGILDENNLPKTYIITSPVNESTLKFVEIHTVPAHAGQNLGAILLYALKAKLGIKLLLSKDEVVSIPARSLIMKLIKNNRLAATKVSGEPLSADEVINIMNTMGDSNHELILESQVSNQPKFNKDLVLSERWYLRNSNSENYD